MFSKPDSPPYWPSRTHLGLLAFMASFVLAACASVPSDTPPGAPVQPTSPRLLPPPSPQISAPAPDAVTRVLAYADRVRLMPLSELAQEVTQLGDTAGPVAQLQLALALSQFGPLRQPSELPKAQELLTRVLGNNSPEAQALQPLARLLAARYGEQRRLEELLDKQNQQTREVQRRLDQTNERLEALKAIERSLTSRTPASAPMPASRQHPSPP